MAKSKEYRSFYDNNADLDSAALPKTFAESTSQQGSVTGLVKQKIGILTFTVLTIFGFIIPASVFFVKITIIILPIFIMVFIACWLILRKNDFVSAGITPYMLILTAPATIFFFVVFAISLLQEPELLSLSLLSVFIGPFWAYMFLSSKNVLDF